MSVVARPPAVAVGHADAWVAYQRQPLSAALLQASLQGVFRRTTPVAPSVPAARSAEDLVDGLIGLALNHQAVQHPYLHALGSGNLPDLPFALRDFARHYSGYVRYGSRFLATLAARLEEPGQRTALQRRLLREAGQLAPEERQALLVRGIPPAWLAGVPSRDLFQRFRLAIDGAAGAAEGGESVAIEVVCWREQVHALVAGGSRAEAVGALLLGTEAIQPTVAQPFLEAIGRVGLDPRAAAFFALPAAAAEPLPPGLRRIAIDLAGSPQGRLELAKGMHKALVLRSAFWAWLHQRALSLSAMQA